MTTHLSQAEAAAILGTKPKRSKYGATAVVIDGHRFASKAEGKRYRELTALRDLACIRNLELQPRYPLIVNGVNCGTYVGDFRYMTAEGRTVCEDVKGVRTATYILKKKLVKALYGIVVLETS